MKLFARTPEGARVEYVNAARHWFREPNLFKRWARALAKRVLRGEIETLERALDDEREQHDNAEATIGDLRAQLERWRDAQRNMITLAMRLEEANARIRDLEAQVRLISVLRGTADPMAGLAGANVGSL